MFSLDLANSSTYLLKSIWFEFEDEYFSISRMHIVAYSLFLRLNCIHKAWNFPSVGFSMGFNSMSKGSKRS